MTAWIACTSIPAGHEPMAKPFTLSIIIPAYNEAERLPATLLRITGFLAGRSHLLPTEIIVADDGSRDGTARVAAGVAMPSYVEMRVVTLPSNRGKGAAVRAGLAASRGERVLITDADLATPIEEIENLLPVRAGIAAGSRGMRRELIARKQPFLRDHLGRLFNHILRGLSVTTLKDTQCGFKLLDGDLARVLAMQLRLDGFAFDVEMLARAERMGQRVVEVPVRWFHQDSSRVRPFRHGLQMLRDTLRIRWWLWTGK
jgi:dolichyl-phosphate beta-glucosyltransferase